MSKRFKPAATEGGEANPGAVPTARQQQAAVDTTTGEAGLPALPEHERLDRDLRQAGGRLKQHFLHFIALAAEVIDKQVWARFGFRNEREYFDERVGVAWRTVVRYLTVHRAVEALPPAQREQARQRLSELGIHKAAVLAPVLRQAVENPAEHDWQELLEQAATVSREALQEQISQRLGLKPRRASAGEGAEQDRAERFLITQCLPPDLQPWAQSISRALQVQLQSRNFDLVVITLFRLAEVELAAVGVRVDPPPTDGPFTSLMDKIDFALRQRR